MNVLVRGMILKLLHINLVAVLTYVEMRMQNIQIPNFGKFCVCKQ